jgi:hypothetical protein
MTLPEPELSFFFAAAAQLEPALRPVFAEHVAQILVPIGTRGPSMSIARSARRWWACGCRRRSRSCGRPRAGIAIRRRSTRGGTAPPPRSAGDYAARVDSMWTQRGLYMS